MLWGEMSCTMQADPKTWSPFQSPQTREILAHMTESEKSRAAWRGAFYGVWCAGTVALPLSYVFLGQEPWVTYGAAELVVIHLVCIPIWTKMQRRFLCSTAWARAQGIRPERLVLFSFR